MTPRLLLPFALVVLLFACGGTTIIDGGAGGEGGAPSSSAAEGGSTASSGTGACWACDRVFGEPDLEVPFCPGEEQAQYDALFACGCEHCPQACGNPVDNAFCSDIGGLYGGVGSACGQCLHQQCPAERAACDDDP